jgi:phenylalanyl-tRNA synthetase beta subunit
MRFYPAKRRLWTQKKLDGGSVEVVRLFVRIAEYVKARVGEKPRHSDCDHFPATLVVRTAGIQRSALMAAKHE